jgi:hypothetical protein
MPTTSIKSTCIVIHFVCKYGTKISLPGRQRRFRRSPQSPPKKSTDLTRFRPVVVAGGRRRTAAVGCPLFSSFFRIPQCFVSSSCTIHSFHGVANSRKISSAGFSGRRRPRRFAPPSSVGSLALRKCGHSPPCERHLAPQDLMLSRRRRPRPDFG